MSNDNDMTNIEQTKILSEMRENTVDYLEKVVKEALADYGKQSNNSSKPGGIVVNGNIIFHYDSSSKDAEALYNKGNCYYFGKGVKQDYAEAAKWYRKAAEQGHAGVRQRSREMQTRNSTLVFAIKMGMV